MYEKSKFHQTKIIIVALGSQYIFDNQRVLQACGNLLDQSGMENNK